MFSLRICHKSISNKMIIEETNLTKVSQRISQWFAEYYPECSMIQKTKTCLRTSRFPNR